MKIQEEHKLHWQNRNKTLILLSMSEMRFGNWILIASGHLLIAVSLVDLTRPYSYSAHDDDSQEETTVAPKIGRVQYERHLRNALFEHYDRKVRPSGNSTDTVSVYVSMHLLHIEGVDEARQVLKVHTWMGFKWNDARLAWDSSLYGQISTLHTADEEIWLPDIALYNNAEGKDIHNYGTTTVVVQSNGDVLWIPPASFSAQCNMSFDDWPNDRHYCPLIIGSWTQHGWDLDLHLADESVGIDTSNVNYVANDQWFVTKVSSNRTSQVYPCCTEPYISLTFNINLRRNPAHYLQTLVYPANMLLLSSSFLFLVPEFHICVISGLIQILTFCGESLFLWTVVPPTYGPPPVVRLMTWSTGSVFCALLWCLLLDRIGSFKKAPPIWMRDRWNPKLGRWLGVLASRYFSPKSFNLRRKTASDQQFLTSEAQQTGDALCQRSQFEESGFQEMRIMEGGPTQDINIEENNETWRIFSCILSRFCLMHYVVLTVIIIAMHRP